MRAEDSMPSFTRSISENGLAILRGLIGRTVGQFYSPCLQVAGMHTTSPSWSIPISTKGTSGWHHRYVVIRCEWFETPELMTDCWELLISEQEKPDGISVNSTGAIVAPCTVAFWHASPVKSVEVYRFEWTAEGVDPSKKEFVSYDNAILFRTEDGKSFCVACQLNGPGIATEVHFSEDEKIIQEFLSDSTLRLSLS